MSRIIDGEEYLTVKEFAAAAKVSNKAIYQQIQGRLEHFTRTLERKKYIQKAALDLFYSSQIQENVKSDSSFIQAEFKGDSMQKALEMLEKQLEIKDKDIAELRRQLEHAYSTIENQSQTIAEMAAKAQYITAADKTAAIMDKQDKQAAEQDPPPKKSLWDRIRGK